MSRSEVVMNVAKETYKNKNSSNNNVDSVEAGGEKKG